MLSFQQFTQAKRKYVALQCDAATTKKLREYCDANGFDLTKTFFGHDQKAEEFDFHCTVFYTPNKIAGLATGVFEIKPVITDVQCSEVFGKEKNIPVLLIRVNEQMRQLYEYFEHVYDMQSDYPTWNAHISITYGTKVASDWSIDTSTLGFPIIFDRITVDDVNRE